MKLQEFLIKKFSSMSPVIAELTKETITEDNIFEHYFHYLTQNYVSLIEELNPYEAFLFYHIYKKPSLTLDPFLAESSHFKEALDSLSKRGLIIVKANISQATLATKGFLFDEIRSFLDEKAVFVEKKQLSEDLALLRTNSLEFIIADVPTDVYQAFYAYGFMFPKKTFEQKYEPSLVDYLKKHEVITQKFLVDEDKLEGVSFNLLSFHCCYELDMAQRKNFTPQMTEQSCYQTRIFNDFIALCYEIQKEGISFTIKGELYKRNLTTFLKIIPNEYILWFLIGFLKQNNFLLELREEFYKLDPSCFKLFHQDLLKTYKSFLKSDKILQNVYDTILVLKDPFFTIADITVKVLNHLKDKTFLSFIDRESRRSLVRAIETLYYMGILVKYVSSDSWVYYSLSDSYKELLKGKELENKNKSLSVSSALQVIAYPEFLDIQNSYLLNIFSEIENFSSVYVYKVTMKSLLRALYFGFHKEDLFNLLREHSQDTLEESLFHQMNSWALSFKSGEIREVLLLKSSKKVLDQIQQKPEYRAFIKERIGDDYAIIDAELKEKLILEESHIYIEYKKNS